VPVKAEVPDGEIRPKVPDPRGKGRLRRLQIRLVRVTASPGGGDIDLGPVRRDIVHAADADVEDIGVLLDNVPRPIAMVGIGVEDGEPADAVGVPEVGDGDGDVVETAVAAEEIHPRVVPARTDKGKRPIQLADADLFCRRYDASDRGPGGASQRVRLYLRNERGTMDLEDEPIVSLGASVEAEPLVLQELVEGGREIGQSPADGQIAPPAEAFMIENAHPCHRSVHGSPFTD